MDPQVVNARMKAWRRAHPEKASASASRHNIARRIVFRTRLATLKDHPCMDCGEKYPPYVMQFDHVFGIKKFDIATGIDYAWKMVLIEVAKCELVCANCHAERTHQRAQAS